MIFSAAYHSTSALSVDVPVADGCEGVTLWGVLVDWFDIRCGWLLSRRTGIVPGGGGGGRYKPVIWIIVFPWTCDVYATTHVLIT